MSIDRFFTVPVTIKTPTGATTSDAEGNPTTEVATIEAMGHVQPLTAKTAADRAVPVAVGERARLVWLPLDTVVSLRSTITFRGATYDVQGDPDDWWVGSSNDHIELVVVRQVPA
ncbi:hypothetical protein KSP35_13060 [Aquihabitans sp. G128]|uniref:hypothetical protein n=1 Tax=Aquihabitans sp. G128 TaxID=2849779 RepID=UPI001C24E6C5|nr:hypothetical protein [Aquihabitans sp. G128]QXC59332.1 hypothetical protein KSP35_13060 [Aquihabitans sp. G128]